MEAILLKAARGESGAKGADRAVAAQLTRFAPSAYQVAVRVLGTPQGAQDVVQQAYLNALTHLRSAYAASKVEEQTWFLRVVANAAKEYRRKEMKLKKREAAAVREAPGAEPAQGEIVAALRVAVNSLEEKYRVPVCLCYEQNLTRTQAAAVLQMPESTVSEHVRIGTEKLRRALERAGYALLPAAVLGGLKQTAPVVPASLAGRLEALVANAAVKAGGSFTAAGSVATAAAKGGIAMKVIAGIVLAGAVAGGVAMMGGGSGSKPLPAEAVPEDLPKVVLDESASRWVVDRFAGNSTAGPDFLQGPARQTGGLGSCSVDPAPDGSVFLGAGMSNKWAKDKILRVSPEGILRLVAGGGSSLGDCPASQAMVRVESLRYSAAEKSLYFVHRTIPCVRRLHEKDGQWLVEVVAGDPKKTGSTDGQGKAALFTQPRSLAITSTGTVYVLDGTNLLRKIEKGQVSTVAKFGGGPKLIDGPLGQASMAITKMSGQICLGENDDILYVADHWNFAVRRIDLKARTVTTPAWSATSSRRKAKIKRPKGGTDGPALTHANFVSGIAFVCWDPVHKALWCGGPDESSLRWLKGGWIRTPLPFKRSNKWRANGTGLKPEEASLVWVHVKAVDKQGRAYISASSSKTGVWRAYEKGGAK